MRRLIQGLTSKSSRDLARALYCFVVLLLISATPNNASAMHACVLDGGICNDCMCSHQPCPASCLDAGNAQGGASGVGGSAGMNGAGGNAGSAGAQGGSAGARDGGAGAQGGGAGAMGSAGTVSGGAGTMGTTGAAGSAAGSSGSGASGGVTQDTHPSGADGGCACRLDDWTRRRGSLWFLPVALAIPALRSARRRGRRTPQRTTAAPNA